jgi:hypothetical protein
MARLEAMLDLYITSGSQSSSSAEGALSLVTAIGAGAGIAVASVLALTKRVAASHPIGPVGHGRV